jgi:hypothetical protein
MTVSTSDGAKMDGLHDIPRIGTVHIRRWRAMMSEAFKSLSYA